jgi:hypothetical protein
VRDQLGHRELDRLPPELAGGALGELLVPLDVLLVLLGLEFARPLLAVDVEHLVEREPVAVFEDTPVIVRDGVVDPAAQEHRAGGWWLLALDVAAAPRLRAAHPQRVRGGCEVTERLAVVALG